MRPVLYLTKTVHFNAAHRVARAEWSQEKNFSYFGKCANENFHGHNYELAVCVKGFPDAETGFVYNAHLLGLLIEKEITEILDHKNLNLDVPYFEQRGLLPTAENLVVFIWDILAKALQKEAPQAQLYRIKLQETHSIGVEYFGASE